MISLDRGVVVKVSELAYRPVSNLKHSVRAKLDGTILEPILFHRRVPLYFDDSDLVFLAIKDDNAPLQRVTFKASSGELTVLMSQDRSELATIIDLLSQRKLTGTVSGEINLNVASTNSQTNPLSTFYEFRYSDNITFSPRSIILIPGMTYWSMLSYSIRLANRIIGQDGDVDNMVMRLLNIAGLAFFKDETIPPLPVTFFDGREQYLRLHLLNICCQICRLPALILVEEPFAHFDVGASIRIVDFLSKIAREFNTAVLSTCSLPTLANTSIFLRFENRLALFSKGYTIFCGTYDEIMPHFRDITVKNSKTYAPIDVVDLLDSLLKENSNPHPVEFLNILSKALVGKKDDGRLKNISKYLSDIAHNIIAQSSVMSSTVMSPLSPLSTASSASSSLSTPKGGMRSKSTSISKLEDLPSVSYSAFEEARQVFLGLGELDEPLTYDTLSLFFLLMKRSFHSKLVDKETIKVKFATCIVPIIAVGYLQASQGFFGSGASGYYTMSLSTFPYTKPLNITALFFLMSLVTFFMQVADFPVFFVKLRLFRNEQRNNNSNSLLFTITTLAVETLFTAFYSYILSTGIYFWTKAEVGYSNYTYFTNVSLLNSILGTYFILLVIAIFKRSRLILNVYFFLIALMVLTGGYAFNNSYFANGTLELSAVNPMRWAFEALTSWKFTDQNYHDGAIYASMNFAIGGFDRDEYYVIFANFASVFAISFFLLTFSAPNWLKSFGVDHSINESVSSHSVMDAGAIDTSIVLSNSVSNPYIAPQLEAMSKRTMSADEKSISRKFDSTESDNAPKNASALLSNNLNALNSKSKQANVVLGLDSLSLLAPALKKTTDAGFFQYRHNLDGVSLAFSSGKIHAIISPKSIGNCVLRCLSGDISLIQDISGGIVYNGQSLNVTPYDAPGKSENVTGRFSFVSKNHELLENLSVGQTLYYAAKIAKSDLSDQLLSISITKLLAATSLEKLKNTKVAALSLCEYKRLCIAEQLVTCINERDAVLLLEEFFSDVCLECDQICLMALLNSLLSLADCRIVVILSESRLSSILMREVDDLTLLNINGKVVFSDGSPSDCLAFINSICVKFSDRLNGESLSKDVLSSKPFPTDDMFAILRMFQYQEHEVENFYNSSASKASTLDKVVALKDSLKRTSDFTDDSSHSRSSLMIDAETIQVKKSGQNGILSKENNKNFDGDSSNDPNRGSIVRNKGGFSKRLCFFAIPTHMCNLGPWYWNLHLYYLFRRELLDLVQQVYLMVTMLFMHIVMGLLFVMVLGKIPFGDLDNTFKTQSFFIMIAFMSMFLNLPFVNYLYKAHLVHLREHSRGVFSNFGLWFIGKMPYAIVKTSFIVVMACISYHLLELNSDANKFGFFVYTSAFLSLSSIGLLECILGFAPNSFTVYQLYYLSVLLYYLLCSLFINYHNLPSGTTSWAPSISNLRWFLQGNMINQFSTEYGHSFNTTSVKAYVDPALNQGNHLQTFFYDYYLSVFRWGGKSDWDCARVLIWFIIFFKLGAFVLFGLEFLITKGGYRIKSHFN